ncbi:NADH-quinone oxidoreductase subunit A [Nitrosopumilus sp. S4]
MKKLIEKKEEYLFIQKSESEDKLVGELAGNYSTVVLMFGFAVVAMAPALLISRMISPRRKSNPVKFLPMECGQVPTGEGRTHFMMQYYPYILMFVIFDVMAIFLYAWGSALLELPKSATLPMMGFLAIMFGAMAFALYQSGRRNIW